MRTRSEVSEEAILESDAALVFLKLRKMIASETQSTDIILGTIAVAAHSLTGATGAAIAMPRDRAVVCVGRSGETAPELGDRLNVDSGISGECLRTGVSLRCDDATRDFHVDAEVCRQLGLLSIAVVPLRGQQGRVGVLEAFSSQSYAFNDEKIDLLGRLAGLAEAAWARSAVADIPAGEPVSPESEVATPVETPVETSVEKHEPVVAAVPLAEVRQVLANAQPTGPLAGIDRRTAIIAAATVLVLILFSIYGWRSRHSAGSLADAGKTAGSTAPPAVGENAAGAGLTYQADVVRPARPSTPVAPPVEKPNAGVSDTTVRRLRKPAPVAGNVNAAEASNADEIPRFETASADPNDLGKVLSTEPALPKLGVPVSQGTSGGVLLQKVQPVYPPEARRRRLEGSVVLDAVVSVQGQVNELNLVSGDPILAQAAMDAVRKWRYSPYALNGKPIPKPMRITISFIAPQ